MAWEERRAAIAEDYAVSVLAAERKLGTQAGDGRKLTVEDRATILQEVGDKLRERNVSACQFSCSSQSIKDEAVIHQRRAGLIQLG